MVCLQKKQLCKFHFFPWLVHVLWKEKVQLNMTFFLIKCLEYDRILIEYLSSCLEYSNVTLTYLCEFIGVSFFIMKFWGLLDIVNY